MINNLKHWLYTKLRASERYTKIDMVYFVSGNFWLLGGRVVVAGSGFLLTVAFANFLSPEAFGTYKYLLAIAGFVAAFTLNGLGAGALRAIGKGNQNVIPALFNASLIWSIPATVVTLCGGAYYLYMGNGTLGWTLVVIAATNPLISNLAITKSLFVATGDFKRATFYNTVRTVAQVVAISIALMLTDSILIITSTFFIVSALIGYITYLQSLRILNIREDKTHLNETMRYTKHLSVIGVLNLAASQLDQLLLWHFLGPVAVATYGIAQGPTREIRTFAESVGAIVFPKFAKKGAAYHLENNTASKRSFQFFLVLCVFAVAYIVASPYLFKIFFPQYLGAVFYSQLIAGLLVLQPRTILDMFLFAHGGIKDRYYIALPSNAIKIVLMTIFIPFYGIMGAIIAAYASEVFTALITYYRYHTYHKRHLEKHSGE